MTAHLEVRRQAIAEALRAVMAEPFPDRPVQPNAAAPEPPRVADPAPEPVHVTRHSVADAIPEPDVQPEPVDPFPASPEPPPSLRDALTSRIDWDEVEELEDLDEDWERASVPPLENVGSMSRTASLALFGHA